MSTCVVRITVASTSPADGPSVTGPGTAAGSSTAAAIGRSQVRGHWSADGDSTALAVSSFAGVGAAAGDSTAAAIGRSLARVLGTAPGVATAVGAGKTTPQGAAAGGSTAAAVGVAA